MSAHDSYPPVVNVDVPDLDPEETNRIFTELSKRPGWSIYGTQDGRLGHIIPPKGPDHDEGLHTGRGDPPEDENPNPFPVAEISLPEAEEHMVKPEPEDLTCWKCQAQPGRKLPDNGAILCPTCESILKP